MTHLELLEYHAMIREFARAKPTSREIGAAHVPVDFTISLFVKVRFKTLTP